VDLDCLTEVEADSTEPLIERDRNKRRPRVRWARDTEGH